MIGRCEGIRFPSNCAPCMRMRCSGFSGQQIVDFRLCIVPAVVIMRRNIPILLTDALLPLV